MVLPIYGSLSPKQKLDLAMEVLKGQLKKGADGQFIIYTGLMESENGEVVEIPEDK